MIKKMLAYVLSITMIIVALSSCGKVKEVKDTSSVEVSNAEVMSEEEKVSSTHSDNSNVSSTQNIEFYKEDFLKYFEQFVQFFPKPIENPKDAENGDFLYFNMLQTFFNKRDNNTLLNSETYVENEVVITSEQNVIIPEKILKTTVEKLFGISNYDFTRFHELKYFQDQLRPLDYYDEKTQCYHMSIGSSFGFLIEFDRDNTEIVYNSNIVSVKTILKYYYDLGKLEKTQEAEFKFKVCKDENSNVYYQWNKFVSL